MDLDRPGERRRDQLGRPFLEMPVEKVREVLEVNLVGAFLASRVAARRMKERGYGKIIHIASVAGLKGEYPEVLDAVATPPPREASSPSPGTWR